jgi:hypothetical protein
MSEDDGFVNTYSIADGNETFSTQFSKKRKPHQRIVGRNLLETRMFFTYYD